jgi:hypothetical protein
MAWRKRVVRAVVAWVVGLAWVGVAGAGEVRLPGTGQTQSYTSPVGEDLGSRRPRSYTMNSNGTVIDNVTGLMWQQPADNTSRTWATAGAYCDGLSLATFSDWRLPSRKELQTLVDYSRPSYNRPSPAIDPTAFPGTQASSYWSSTSEVEYGYFVWSVHFNNGRVGCNSKTYNGYVRCVRSGQ